MSTEIVVPSLGESVTSAVIAKIIHPEGSHVQRDEPLIELETDKVNIEVNAPESGTLGAWLIAEGDEVEIGTQLGTVDPAQSGSKAGATPPPTTEPQPSQAAAKASPALAEAEQAPAKVTQAKATPAKATPAKVTPAAAKLIDETGVSPESIAPSGPRGHITKGDVLQGTPTVTQGAPTVAQTSRATDPRGEEVVKMSTLRKRVAERLKMAQDTAAILTTFNEINMGAVMKLRQENKEAFEKKYQTRLGFLSFFVKAVVSALQDSPLVNAEIFEDTIIFKNYYDIGIAVGSGKGLVVPILRDADTKTIAEIEAEIADFGKRAQEGKLSINEMTGGTYTISNGGVYGSLLSTPIINPPQSAILGLHKIEKRPIVDAHDQIVVAPMMYVAMSYDHRIIDGREAVTFLVHIKKLIEDPNALLLNL